MGIRTFFKTQPVPANTREILALERTRLANERTLLAYIRSSLYLLVGGIAVIQLEDFYSIHWVGYVALVICLVFLAIGISRFILLKRKLYIWNKVLGAELLEERLKAQNNIEKPQE